MYVTALQFASFVCVQKSTGLVQIFDIPFVAHYDPVSYAILSSL